MADHQTKQWLITLSPIRATFPGDATPQELDAVRAHFAYLTQALDEGSLVLAGRTSDEPPMGLVIFEAPTRAAAERFLAKDPAVEGGVFTGTLRPYSVALRRD